jgi:hypothetical protein
MKVHAAQVKQNDTSAEIEFYEKKLAENKRAAANVLRAIESGTVTKTLPERLQELENEQTVLEGEISYLKSNRYEFDEDEILFMLMQYLNPFSDESEEAYRKRIITCFVAEVYLYDDRLVVFFNISSPDGKLRSSDLEKVFDQRLVNSTIDSE